MTIFNVELIHFWCRRDTAANWTSVNPILASGEFGVETDNTGALPRKFKLGDGITAWNSLPYSDASSFAAPFAVATGTGDALIADFSPDARLVDGAQILLRASAANTGAATLAADGVAARAITKQGGSALAAGDIAAAGHELILRYRASIPRWELLNPATAAGGGGASFTPTTIAAGAIFTVPVDTQLLYSATIDVLGTLVVNGTLAGV